MKTHTFEESTWTPPQKLQWEFTATSFFKTQPSKNQTCGGRRVGGGGGSSLVAGVGRDEYGGQRRVTGQL